MAERIKKVSPICLYGKFLKIHNGSLLSYGQVRLTLYHTELSTLIAAEFGQAIRRPMSKSPCIYHLLVLCASTIVDQTYFFEEL